jgi:5'-deoxynucleotidase YfbR-like HD superfamily hydrolase
MPRPKGVAQARRLSEVWALDAERRQLWRAFKAGDIDETMFVKEFDRLDTALTRASSKARHAVLT